MCVRAYVGGEGREGEREGRGGDGEAEIEAVKKRTEGEERGIKKKQKRGGRDEKGEKEKEVSSYKMHLTTTVTSVAYRLTSSSAPQHVGSGH